MLNLRILVLRRSEPFTAWLRTSLEAAGYETEEAGLDPQAVMSVCAWQPQVVVVTLSPRHAYVCDVIRGIREVDSTIRIIVACEEGLDDLTRRDLVDLDVEGVMRLADGPLALDMWVRAAARAWRSRMRDRRRQETWRTLVDVAEELREAASSEDVLRIVLCRLQSMIGFLRAQALLAGPQGAHALPNDLRILRSGTEQPRAACVEHPTGCACDDELFGVLSAMARQAVESHRLRTLVAEDELTGVFTRDTFSKTALTCIQSVARQGGTFSLAVFDVDRFKRINDTYGHLAGDKILREVTSTVRGTLRPQDFIGRFGGDEFLIGLRDTPGHTAYHVIERLRGRLKERVLMGKDPVTISCGVIGLICGRPGPSVRLDNDAASRILQQMLAAADRLLYVSKERGRDAVHVDDDMELSCIAIDSDLHSEARQARIA